MKYTIQRLDGRHSYHKLFEYYIGFPLAMPGPLDFSRAQKWFFQTYGWSAEIRMYHKIYDWDCNRNQLQPFLTKSLVNNNQNKISEYCNPHWSWTNNAEYIYRIYVSSEKELSFFCLANPVDQ